MADNVRSIPSVADGLKPAQRKVIWASFKKSFKKEMRVAQLVGYVSNAASYHHGEASLSATIVNLAQQYVGSNNINLLLPRSSPISFTHVLEDILRTRQNRQRIAQLILINPRMEREEMESLAQAIPHMETTVKGIDCTGL